MMIPSHMWLKGRSCKENITHLREWERNLQGARSHAVAAGGKIEREMLPRIVRKQKQLTKLWNSFAKSCMR